MSERLTLHDPLFKLAVRFTNGEVVSYVLQEPIDSRALSPDAKYAIISSFLVQNPSECTEVNTINLRDVTYLKTERVTLEQLAGSHRMAGIGSQLKHAKQDSDDRSPKSISQIKFI